MKIDNNVMTFTFILCTIFVIFVIVNYNNRQNNSLQGTNVPPLPMQSLDFKNNNGVSPEEQSEVIPDNESKESFLDLKNIEDFINPKMNMLLNSIKQVNNNNNNIHSQLAEPSFALTNNIQHSQLTEEPSFALTNNTSAHCSVMCPDTQQLVNNVCVDKYCPVDFTCAPGETCENGKCIVKPFVCPVTCPESQILVNGICVTKQCPNDFTCPPGSSCDNGVCTITKCPNDPCPPGANCQNIQCPNNDACACGKCFVSICPNETCPPGSICNTAQCPPNSSCSNGSCTLNICPEDVCPPGFTCNVAGCDPATQYCLNGTCINGTLIKCPGDPCPQGMICIDATCPYGTDCKNGKCSCSISSVTLFGLCTPIWSIVVISLVLLYIFIKIVIFFYNLRNGSSENGIIGLSGEPSHIPNSGKQKHGGWLTPLTSAKHKIDKWWNRNEQTIPLGGGD